MQIILGLLALVIIAALIFSNLKLWQTQKKTTIIKIILSAILLLWLYESMIDSKADNNRKIVLSFSHGKKIVCDDKIVTSKNFYYENGTESFVAKDDNISLRGVIYPISEYEIQSE